MLHADMQCTGKGREQSGILVEEREEKSEQVDWVLEMERLTSEKMVLRGISKWSSARKRA